jgi:hypothetical protein
MFSLCYYVFGLRYTYRLSFDLMQVRVVGMKMSDHAIMPGWVV